MAGFGQKRPFIGATRNGRLRMRKLGRFALFFVLIGLGVLIVGVSAYGA